MPPPRKCQDHQCKCLSTDFAKAHSETTTLWYVAGGPGTQL